MRDELLMQRCFQLALLGAGSVSPNPLVGALLCYDGKIIGEGWHQQWGAPHAEVNCIKSVLPENAPFIPYSTLYCNLEPCAHYGKTPPCADLILSHKIPRVVIANTDPNPLVAGKGLSKLIQAGVNVTSGVLETEGLWLNRIFFTWIQKKRPFILLKWAQSADGFLGKKETRTAISNASTLRLVHKWRSETDAILVGSNTALFDNPRLDVRHYFGKNPLRIVFDQHGKMPENHHLLDDATDTWVYGKTIKDTRNFSRTTFIPLEGKVVIDHLLETLKQANKSSLMVEGGASVLQEFIDSGFWDEIRILENEKWIREGVVAPVVPSNALLQQQFQIETDVVRIFTPGNP